MSAMHTALLDMPAAEIDVASDATQKSRPERLLHGYLHKTSNSLCGIKGYASLIASELCRDQRTTRWARKIIAEVETLEEVYRSVQDVAFPAERIAVGGDLASVVGSATASASREHVGLIVRIVRLTEGRILLPAHDLEVALGELLRNSAESRPGSVPVTVWIETGITRDGRLILCVRDDGPGMDEAVCGDAREPFVTTKDGHMGIGLTRVETIMDIYGLAWSLTSAPQGGTTVELEVGRMGDQSGKRSQSEREC